ncbi:MAG: hypothetical protein ACE5H4_11600 [Candidatus Thorarchaeota archaeon]
MKYMGDISIRELCTTWWSKAWIRVIVLALIPIGIIDVCYTLLATELYGVAIEFNPITRFLLANNLWLVWSLMNIVGFSLFCMLAGSYYLHTRNNLQGPNTLWLSLILALRLGLAVYNTTYFYIPFVLTIYPPLWTGLFTFTSTFVVMDKLLTRRVDITRRSIKSYFTVRLSNIQDARLIRTATADAPKLEAPARKKVVKTSVQKSTWVKRGVYITLGLLVAVAMGWVIEVIGVFTGLTSWSERYGWLFFFNELSGRGFLLSIVGILAVMSVSMYFIIRAFETTEDLPYE